MQTDITDLNVSNSYSILSLAVTSPGIADGITPVTVTITVRDKSGVVMNFVPTYAVTGTGNTIGACSPSNASGVSTCQLRSTVAETKTISMLMPHSLLTATVVFDPQLPAMPGFAVTSGGGLSSGGAIQSQSSIGLPTSPVLLESLASPGTPRARTGLQGVLFEP